MLVYFLVGIGSHFAPARFLPYGQLYPFFSWFLFARTPNQVTDYAVRLMEVQGRKLDPPPFIQDADHLAPDVHSIKLHDIVQKLGMALERKDRESARHASRMLERNFLTGATRYQVVKVTYNPLNRWQTGAFEEHSLEVLSYEPGAR